MAKTILSMLLVAALSGGFWYVIFSQVGAALGWPGWVSGAAAGLGGWAIIFLMSAGQCAKAPSDERLTGQNPDGDHSGSQEQGEKGEKGEDFASFGKSHRSPPNRNYP